MPLLKRKLPYRRYFLLLAGFSLVIVLASIVLAVYTILNTNRNLSAFDRSYSINSKLEHLMSLLNDQESAQRGYIVTSDPIFWETFKESNAQLQKEFTDLYEFLKNDKDQKYNLDQLKQDINARIELLRENKVHFDRMKLIDDSLRANVIFGREIMNRVKYKIHDIEEQQAVNLKDVQERIFRSSRLSVYIIILTCGLSLLMLVSILFVLNREYQSKAAIERELIASERMLQEQVHKLNLSNKELEQFAYVASHDLQEPLRKIISFSEKIDSKLSNYPDEEVTGSLKRLTLAADRMRILIAELLNYSRATRVMDANEKTDLNSSFREITDDLGIVIQSRKAVLDVQKLNTVKGNAVQIRQLFQNLVSNALKFNVSAQPVVTVRGESFSSAGIRALDWGKELLLKYENYYCVFMTDNGIGFDRQYLGQIFVIFQRLHGRSEYEGTGIGLAICKRIAENHGGFITARSIPGEGATFIVGFPV
jgi:signal transduction histidine kinase